MQIEQNYKGYTIDLDSTTGNFKAYKDGVQLFSKQSLTEIKKTIDDAEKKAIRQTCIINLSGWSNRAEFKDGTITSINEEDRHYGRYYDVWVSWKDDNDTRRGKESFSHVLKPIDENRQLIAEIVDIANQISKLEGQKKALEEKLIKFTPQDFGYDIKEE